jgi:hypothetical protein
MTKEQEELFAKKEFVVLDDVEVEVGDKSDLQRAAIARFNQRGDFGFSLPGGGRLKVKGVGSLAGSGRQRGFRRPVACVRGLVCLF